MDGSPSDDLTPRDAPAATVVTPGAADQKRHKNAQAALTKIVRAKCDLTFAIKTSEPEDLVGAINAITVALERGLAWFASEDGLVKLSVKIAGVAHTEKRFFGLVEKLGIAAAPSLARLVVKCRRDPDLSTVWSGALENGQQALGAAARALAGVDPGARPEIAAYGMCIDAWHELYFRSEIVPHFTKSHGWRQESFAFAIADIVQVRGNLGDDFVAAWRRSGLAAAAEAAYSPAAFSMLMHNIRDQMLEHDRFRLLDLKR